jgi:alkanesulfonate monooxygenase SsuD/methylene tetrahydromethanopterin reductase-like flavin-dependent oxidoreductase (luciferase family)
MTNIQFGFTMPIDQLKTMRRATYVQDMHRALNLIEGHFDSIWVIDHLEDVLESFTTLTFMAALHPKFRLGHTVICHSFRNPALLAKMGATLQLLSGGRFQLGIGAGWHAREYKAYGYDYPPGPIRVEQLEETLQIVRAMWTQPRASYMGKYHQITDVDGELRPEPVPQIMVGGTGPKMRRITAKYADEWNVSSTGPQQYEKLSAKFAQTCADVGRDPSTVRRSWSGGCVCAPNWAEIERFAGDRYITEEDDFSFVGTPPQVIEQLQSFMDMGVTGFMVDCGGFPNLTTLEMLVQEVIPVLKR